MRQLSIILLVFLLSAAPMPGQEQAANSKPLTNANIISLTESGVPSTVIGAMIRSSESDFDTSVEAIVKLHKEKVAPEVLSLMAQATLDKNRESPRQGPWSIVFGVGAAAVYSDSVNESEYVLMDSRSVRPAFVTSALRLNSESRWSHGPMLVTDVELGKDGASVTFNSIGVGYMVSARQLSTDSPNANNTRVNGLGLGVAYMLDQSVLLHHRVDPQQTRELSGHALAVVLVYSFGKPADRTR